MAIPAIDPEELEKFSLILNGAPLMITGEQAGTASAANPAGLRVAGGNLFRDYTAWTENEIDDWNQGIGHAMIGDKGYYDARHTTTLFDDIRLGFDFTVPTAPENGKFTGVVNPSEATAAPGTKKWTTDPLMEHGFVEASDANIYFFHGFIIYKYDSALGTWSSWFDVRSTIFSAAWQASRQSYIIDMCEFSGHLVIVTTPYFRPTDAPTPYPPHFIIDGPLTNEFLIQTTTVGGNPALYAYPNVFAINLDSKKPYTLGAKTQFVLPMTLALDATHNLFTAGYPTGALCATVCYSFGGFLFIGGSGGFAYTGGELSPAGSTPTPNYWKLDGTSSDFEYPATDIDYFRLPSPLNLSTKQGGSRWATGFGGIQGQTIGDFSVYMATSRSVYLCDLAVPTLVKVMDFDGEWVRNGKGMVTHQNDIYLPTRNGVRRFTQGGQALDVGMDSLPQNPVTIANGNTQYNTHVRLVTAPNTLLSIVAEYRPASGTATRIWPNRIMALKGQGWLPVLYEEEMHTMHFSQPQRRIFFAYSPASSAMWARGSANVAGTINLARLPFAESEFVADTMVADGTAKYKTLPGSDGKYIHLGWFDAGAPLLDKDWHSISVYGRCMTESDANSVRVLYKFADTPVDCRWAVNEPDGSLDLRTFSGWSSLGYTGAAGKPGGWEWVIPTSHHNPPGTPERAAKYIGIILCLDNAGIVNTSPIVEGIKLKYFVPIGDYFRFSYSVTLPKDCLANMCGELLPEYDQGLWNEALLEACCSVEPVPFRDLDGKEYLIRVESESRRTDKMNYVGPPKYREFDITWNLVFIQLMNPTICDPSWTP